MAWWLLSLLFLIAFGIVRRIYVLYIVRPGTLYTRKLPNGMDFTGLRGDTLEDIIYHENFIDKTYFRHGIKVDSKSFVLDVGANIGLFSLSLLKEYPGIRIHCIEPVPILHEGCKRNVEKHQKNPGDVVCHNVALGETEGTVSFNFKPQASCGSGMFKDDDVFIAKDRRVISWLAAALDDGVMCGILPGILGVIPPLLRGPYGLVYLVVLLPFWIVLFVYHISGAVPEVKFDAKITTLDKILRDNNIKQVDLLKVDVEGAEFLVMKSISDDAYSKIRQIVCEVHDIDNRTKTITKMLTDRGYEVRKEDEEHLATHKLLHLDTLYAYRK
eukprot:PhF_6_TR4411/c0_g1_i1/m.5956